MSADYENIVVIFADQDVGLGAVRYVIDNYPRHLKCVVTMEENEISELARRSGCQTLCQNDVTEQSAKIILEGVRIIFLAWWPRLVPRYILGLPMDGVVNFHPSLLPYNRGKHYNFWTIVENTPFGVTLHFADEGVDSGDILFQSPIEKTWEDTGGALYAKAKQEMLALFRARYMDIVERRYQRVRQDLGRGRTHYARELDAASRISIDEHYSARKLLDLLRARTFEGKPGCYFYDCGKKYEVRVSIKEIPHESD